jgi:dinuclear metal center YbgI/SA1388 family protein
VSASVPVPLGTLASYLDSLLRISETPDSQGAANGLQVANRGDITRIVAAVDASQATIDAVAAGGDGALILVHHGLFWDGKVAVTGRRYRRLRTLFDHDLALYSAHIPLDLHPDLGNNVALADLLGVPVHGWFGEYKGVQLGVWGEVEELPRESLADLVKDRLKVRCRMIPGGPPMAHRVGIITGSAGSMLGDAVRAGLDTYITGEAAHHHFFDAVEGGINMILAGHYATEQLGVQRLAEHLAARFGLAWEFHHHDTGL